jgi:hypothetical protein
MRGVVVGDTVRWVAVVDAGGEGAEREDGFRGECRWDDDVPTERKMGWVDLDVACDDDSPRMRCPCRVESEVERVRGATRERGEVFIESDLSVRDGEDDWEGLGESWKYLYKSVLNDATTGQRDRRKKVGHAGLRRRQRRQGR